MDAQILEKRLTRERAARAEAERLLESKSAELFASGEELRKTAEQLVLQSSQLSAILDSALAGMCLADKDRIIVRANAYAHRVFGYAKDELCGRALHDIFDGEYIQSVQAIGFETASLSDQTGDEVLGRVKDGGCVPIELSASELFLEDQRFTLWIFHDITKRKAQEAERDRLEEELRQAQKLEALGILASGVAHEINTPVQFIGDNLRFLEDAFGDLFGELVATAGETTQSDSADVSAVAAIDPSPEQSEVEYFRAEVPEAIQQSLDGVSRIAEIVAAVREFSHPGTKEKSPLDINTAVQSTVTLSTNHWKYVAELTSDFEDGLPEVMCVPGEFNQVVLNLIVNAAQAIEGLGVPDKGDITVRTRRVGGQVEVSVADTGGGIPSHVQPKMFDPFYTTKEVGKGTGQGLSLVHSIVVKKHGGTISFDTTEGVGTTFYVRWPILAEEEAREVA